MTVKQIPGWLALLLSATLMAVPAAAQNWPEKPIRLIYPYPAGGMGEPLFRLFSPAMEQKLGQRFVLETRPGASGNIGTRLVADAPPDGYTLLLAATNNYTINQFLYPDLGFDPLKAFAPITLLAQVPSVFYVNPSVPARNLQEFIAWARQNPGKINFASPGPGSTPHVNIELISQISDLRMVHIAYKGVSPALTATVANDVQLYLAGLGPGRGLLAAGKLRAIAVGGSKRLPGLPEVPTLEESGFKGMTASNWLGLAAPAGTAPAIVARVAESVQAALASPETVQKIVDLGLEPGGSSPREFSRQIAREARVWEAVVRKAGIKAE